MGLTTYIKRALSYIKNGTPQNVINQINVTVKTCEPSSLLEGRHIVITGGSRGLGYYMAKKCLDEGAEVLITGRNEEKLKEIAAELGEKCHTMVFDAKNASNMPEFIKEAAQKFSDGKIDSLISNAGISLHEGGFENVTEDGWDTQIDTNLKGSFFAVKSFAEYFIKENTEGNIIVVTSERSKRPDDIPYGISKVGCNSFIKAMSAKLIGKGIRINGIAPGVTASDMTGFDRDGNMYASWQPQNRIFLPEEVAEVAGFLLSDTSKCISGEIIACDQGRYITTW